MRRWPGRCMHRPAWWRMRHHEHPNPPDSGPFRAGKEALYGRKMPGGLSRRPVGLKTWRFTLKRLRLSLPAAVAAGCLCFAGVASANPIFLPTIPREVQHDRAIGAINPPAPPCPQASLGVSCSPVPETPALGVPFPGNMAYYGGHVQVTPQEYLVYWGWGESGAWPAGTSCSAETITEGSFSATLACDPDGAGRYMADFL